MGWPRHAPVTAISPGFVEFVRAPGAEQPTAAPARARCSATAVRSPMRPRHHGNASARVHERHNTSRWHVRPRILHSAAARSRRDRRSTRRWCLCEGEGICRAIRGAQRLLGRTSRSRRCHRDGRTDWCAERRPSRSALMLAPWSTPSASRGCATHSKSARAGWPSVRTRIAGHERRGRRDDRAARVAAERGSPLATNRCPPFVDEEYASLGADALVTAWARLADHRPTDLRIGSATKALRGLTSLHAGVPPRQPSADGRDAIMRWGEYSDVSRRSTARFRRATHTGHGTARPCFRDRWRPGTGAIRPAASCNSNGGRFPGSPSERASLEIQEFSTRSAPKTRVRSGGAPDVFHGSL